MKKLLSGIVKTNSAKDTSVVEVASWHTHRIFRKRYQTTKRFLVHNAGNAAQIGQTVTIAPCRPISKRKSWTIIVPTAPAEKPKLKAKTSKEKA